MFFHSFVGISDIKWKNIIYMGVGCCGSLSKILVGYYQDSHELILRGAG
jgi:hypothetical protein